MATVAGHVDDFMAWGNALDLLDMVDLDTVVDLVPEPAEYHFEKTNGGIGVVRGNFVAVAQGLGFSLGQGDFLALGLIGDGLAHQWVVDQAFDQVAAVRNVRADDGGLEVAKVYPQHALGHAYRALVAFVVLHQLAQVNGGGKLHTGLAAQNQHGQQPS
ncbi:hypothetical protein D3C78_913710 [compost metagenome]